MRVPTFSAALLVTLAGCVIGHLTPETARIPGPVGHVEVAASDLAADRIARYRELVGDRVIREAIESELADAALWQPGGEVVVQVTVTTFRLRSTANAFWAGAWAGDDELEGHIEVRRAAAAPDRISFRFSSNDDVYFIFSSRARFRRLAQKLALEIRTHVDGVGKQALGQRCTNSDRSIESAIDFARGEAGGEFPQDAPRHGARHPRDSRQARRPHAQHADARPSGTGG